MELRWQINTHPYTYNIIPERPVIIGRKRDCDIVLGDKAVSRRHAEIFLEQGLFHLHNLSHSNAIYVFTHQTLAPGQTIPLKSEDVLRFGFSLVRIQSIQKLADRYTLNLVTKHQTYQITDQQPMIIGRQNDCDIILDSKLISRRHAQIFVEHGTFHARNISQTTPIQVHTRQKLSQGDIFPIKPGDTFSLGFTQIHTQAMQNQTEADLCHLAKSYQVRCPGCQRKIRATLKDCPWCGVSLACGLTT